MTPDQINRKTRRGFIAAGLAATAAAGTFEWLRQSELQDGIPAPLRGVLEGNERTARAYFRQARRAKEFAPTLAREPRANGSAGLDAELELDSWKLQVNDGARLTLEDVYRLPKVEMVTELHCIEGWSQIVQWTGVRFSDFTARYSPESAKAKYVSLDTPDGEYYVGLDMESAMHPQTLLCYEMNGSPLTSEHGAPLRLVIPVKYGIKNLKRIGTIRYSDSRPVDYWAERGYDWYAGL
ncbi:MAG: molybdopterin-dependent oxidoreductase [Bryobacteraceae bacterium]